MAYVPPINEGLLTDFVRNIGSIIPDLPGQLDDNLKRAVETAVAVVDPQLPTPPINEKPDPVPTATKEQRNDIVRALDTAISAIGVLLKVRFLIPDQYERPLEMLAKALETVRNWID